MWKETTKTGIRFCERYADPVTGELKRVCITVEKDTRNTRKQAQLVLEEKIREKIEAARREAEWIPTLTDLSELYYAYQKGTQAVGTAERNHRSWKTILDLLGPDLLPEELTAGYVNRKFLESGKEPGTLNEFLKRFKAMLRWAYRNDYIEDVTWLNKLTNYPDRPHRTKISEKFLDRAELTALLNDIQDHEEWYLLTQFLAFSGLRFGEAAALMKKDVDLDALEIHVSRSYDSANKILNDHAKNYYSERDVHIQPELLPVCRAINRRMNELRLSGGLGKCELFFFHEDGQPIPYYAYHKFLKDHAAAVTGKTMITPHALRHTHASILFEQGFSMDEVARRLGHGNSRITREIYVHVTHELKTKDNKKLDSVWFRNA